MATYNGTKIHRTAYLVGRRRALNCPPCANEATHLRIKEKINRRRLVALFIEGTPITDRQPAFCSNCCEPINLLR
jgi:hypothetical protein